MCNLGQVEIMNFAPRPYRAAAQVSTKDRILNIPFGLSALVAFALSFSLFQPDGRPFEFFGCLLICAVTLAFVDRKRDMLLAAAAFILLRLVWAAVLTGIQFVQSSGHR